MSLIETASGLADRHLKPEYFLYLRSCYTRLRQSLAPVIRQVYGDKFALGEPDGRDGDLARAQAEVRVHALERRAQPLELSRVVHHRVETTPDRQQSGPRQFGQF